MNRTRKYLIIILTILTALLCAAGASTWIISNPTTFTPGWGKAEQRKIYVNAVVETTPNETVTGSYLANLGNKKLQFCFDDGTDASEAIQQVSLGTADSGGAVANVDLKGTASITVGCTYSVPLSVTVTDSGLYALAGTYESNDGGLTGIKELGSSSKILLKHKTVQVGTTYYTIEDALKQSGNATVRANTAFTGTNVASLAGYSKKNGNYTVANGETLLLPFSESDTEGYIHPTWQKDGDTSNLPSNSSGAKLYQSLTIPTGITVTNVGTVTIGAFTGQKDSGHIGGISGGYAEVTLSGTLSSSGTLNVYGNIKGNGTVNATAGTVLERMEILDWPGGSAAGGRFTARPGKDYSLDFGDLAKLATGGTISISDPNEFPFEGYQLQAIVGPTLTVSYGVTYCGNIRIFTSQQSQLGVTVPPMLSIANLNVVNRDSDSADALFKLNNGATFVKQVVGGREKVTVYNGFIGGKTSITMDLMKASIHMDTAKVKFPISAQIDLTIDGGSSSSAYAYEIMQGATVNLTNNAELSLTNTEDGSIAYGGGRITVGSDCTLTIKGKYGGTIEGAQNARNAILNFQAEASNSGYIGGTGGRNSTTFTFTGTLTTVSAHGTLGQAGGNKVDGTFVQNTTYTYINGAWRTKEIPSVTYQAGEGSFKSGERSVTKQYSELEDLQGEKQTLSQDNINLVEKPTRPYYTFLGWATKQSGATQADVLTNGLQITVGDPVTLYAVWAPIEYTIQYTSIWTGEAPTEQQPNYEALPQTFRVTDANVSFAHELVLEGYNFVGIYTDNACTPGTDISKLTGEQLVALLQGDTVTLYVQWAKQGLQQFNISYENTTEVAGLNWQSFNDNRTSVYKTEEYSIWVPDGYTLDTIEEAIRANTNCSHDFLGWYIDGTEQKVTTFQDIIGHYAEDDSTSIDVKLVARWEAKLKVMIQDTVASYNVTMYLHAGEIVTNSEYDNKNSDPTVSTYFVKWQLDDSDFTGGENSIFTYTIPSERTADAPMNFVATRANKAHVTVNDSKYGKILDGYYQPNTTIEIPKDAEQGDYDVTVDTYFNGWEVSPKETKFNVGDPVSVPGEGDFTINSIRAQKVVLTVTVTATGKAGSNGWFGGAAQKGDDVTAKATVSFPESSNAARTVEAKGIGGTGKGNNGSTDTKHYSYHLKPGQKFSVTTTYTTIWGRHNSCAGQITCNDASVTLNDEKDNHNHSASGTAEEGKAITITVSNS